MVRKTTRAAALKATEKNRRESPRRTTRRRKSSSKSESSDEEVLSKIKQAQLSNASEKGSSDNETDKESKKPLKKRTRSMAVNETKKRADNSETKSAEKEIKTEERQSEEEEVNEGDNSKGKSKCINKSNIVNDNAETENENAQVTEESPNLTKDDNPPNDDDRSKNGTDPSAIDVNISQTLVAEMTCDNQHTEITTDETTEIVISEPVKSEPHNDEDAKDLTQADCKQELLDVPNNDEKSSEECTNTPEIHPITSDDSTSNNAKSEDGKPSSEAPKKIKLHRFSRDKRISVSEQSGKPEEKEENKKKIILKRHDIKPTAIKEQKEEELNNDSLSPIEQPVSSDWGSVYEPVKENDETKAEKSEEKSTRKKITLKRSAVEESGKLDQKELVVLVRSTSCPEKNEARKSSTDNIVINERQRKHSVVSEKSTSESEGKPEKPTKPRKVVKLIRKLPEELQKPLSPGEESTKKYNWTHADISHLKVNNVLLLDSLKEICPTIELLDEADVDLEITTFEPKSPEKSIRKSFKELEEEEMENIEAELNAEAEEVEMKNSIIAANRNFSIVEDSVSKLNPPPSPPRNPVSEVLFITNLVRPFTVKQLKELLERTGKLKEDGFWTDKIKSKCYVCYETAEEAEVTRNALHGVHWPIGNGKKLIIDYSTREEMETAKNPPVVILRKEKSPEKENKKPELNEELQEKVEVRPSRREWDVGKDQRHRSRSRSKEGRERKHSRRSFTPEDHHKKRRHEEAVPQKAMDDLFLKTQATPSIYWQPLSPEEIAHKQQLRQARLEENKRRLEKIRSSGRGGIRDRGGRDRNFRRR